MFFSDFPCFLEVRKRAYFLNFPCNQKEPGEPLSSGDVASTDMLGVAGSGGAVVVVPG